MVEMNLRLKISKKVFLGNHRAQMLTYKSPMRRGEEFLGSKVLDRIHNTHIYPQITVGRLTEVSKPSAAAMYGLRDPKPHVVLVPLYAQGHMIPMIDLARLLAGRGVLVSVVTSPFNASRIRTTVDCAIGSGLPIRLITLPFPCREAGLPEGCENLDVLQSMDLVTNFFDANCMLRAPLEKYLREHPPLPSCIISDWCHSWTMHVANEFKIPRLIFWGICCFTLLCQHNLNHYKTYEGIADDMEPVVVPSLPVRIAVTRAQSPIFFSEPIWDKYREELSMAESTADGIVVNTFRGLEPVYADLYQKAKAKKIWAIGPVSLCNKNAGDMAARGDKASVDAERCLSWLDSMNPRSVVYVSLGSLARSLPSQLVEIGSSLEESNVPFIWVIKAGERFHEVEKWLSEGFQERTSKRGLIIKGWAPQVLILSHPSVGGFLTHCGWNSTLEGISAGVPFITWPCFGDQFVNERFIVEVLRIGVPVGVKTPSNWASREVQAFLKREEIAKAVKGLMDEGEEGLERRKRAGKYGEMARDAMEAGGSSYISLTLMIQDTIHLN